MSDSYFYDTNVVAYAFDKEAPKKKAIAQELIEKDNWFLSWQVIQEFVSVARYKFKEPLHSEDIADYLDVVLWPRCRIYPSPAIHRSALDIHTRTQYRYYDCLIVASALASKSNVLYSRARS